MYCENCGNVLKDNSKFCSECGYRTSSSNSNPIDVMDNGYSSNSSTNPITSGVGNNNYNSLNFNSNPVNQKDKVNILLVIIGFLIPVIGLALFISLKKQTPKKANAIGIAALIGGILSFILYFIIYASIFMNILDEYDYNYDDYDYDYDYNYDYNYDDYDYDYNDYYKENRI